MAWKRKTEEFEADLYKVPMPRFWRMEKGELERKAYEDGEEKLQVQFHGLPEPSDGMARVLIDGEPVCEVPVREGRGRQEISTTTGEAIPKVGAGSVAEIEVHGEVLLRGTFKRD
jgi:hypothetical protein